MMTRDQMCKRKAEIDAELSLAADDLKAAQRRAAQTGQYLDNDQYNALHERIYSLRREALELNVRIARAPKASSVNDCFRDAAFRILTPELYRQISEVAAVDFRLRQAGLPPSRSTPVFATNGSSAQS